MSYWCQRGSPHHEIGARNYIAFVIPLTAAADDAFAIRYDGFGPVRVGMTKAAASRALGEELQLTGRPGNAECEYLHLAKRWKGVEFMFSRGRVVRIDVAEGTTTTESGVRIGDSISRIKKACGARVPMSRLQSS